MILTFITGRMNTAIETGCLAASCLALLVGCNTPTTPETGSPTPAPTTEAKPPLASPEDHWTVDKEVNQLDRSTKLMVSGNEVYLRCSPKFQAYIVPYIPSLGNRLDTDTDHGQTVRYRVDESPVKRDHWDVSDDYTALFLSKSAIRAALKGKKLVVEFKPDYVVPDTQTFDFEGLQEAARKAGCKL